MKEAHIAEKRPDLTPAPENRRYDPTRESSKQETINLLELNMKHARSYPDMTKKDTSMMVSFYSTEDTRGDILDEELDLDFVRE
jgi:hypothetical protein